MAIHEKGERIGEGSFSRGRGCRGDAGGFLSRRVPQVYRVDRTYNRGRLNDVILSRGKNGF